jgi:hypothetical protein
LPAPANLAFDMHDGYRGLLLHYTSPRLAEAVYRYIASPWMEVAMFLLLGTSALVANSTIIFTGIPSEVSLTAGLLLLPALHRLLMTDGRVLRLLFRQFDAW